MIIGSQNGLPFLKLVKRVVVYIFVAIALENALVALVEGTA
jgi:hypothetical protein